MQEQDPLSGGRHVEYIPGDQVGTGESRLILKSTSPVETPKQQAVSGAVGDTSLFNEAPSTTSPIPPISSSPFQNSGTEDLSHPVGLGERILAENNADVVEVREDDEEAL